MATLDPQSVTSMVPRRAKEASARPSAAAAVAAGAIMGGMVLLLWIL